LMGGPRCKTLGTKNSKQLVGQVAKFEMMDCVAKFEMVDALNLQSYCKLVRNFECGPLSAGLLTVSAPCIVDAC